MELTVQTRTVADRTVLAVTGEIDVYTAPTLRDHITDAIAAGVQHVVVDLTGVDFLDSTGLGVLVGGLKRISTKGGTLAIVCPHERLLKIFRITGLERVLSIYPSVEEATATEPTATEPAANTGDESIPG